MSFIFRIEEPKFLAKEGMFFDPKNIKYIIKINNNSPKPRFKNKRVFIFNYYLLAFTLVVSSMIGVAINKEE